MVRVAAGVAVGGIRLQRGANNGFVLFRRILDGQFSLLRRHSVCFGKVCFFLPLLQLGLLLR